MKKRIASGERLFKCRNIPKISLNPLRVQVRNIAKIAGRPHQQPQLRSLLGQNSSNMASEKSSSASDESTHSALSDQHLAHLYASRLLIAEC